MTTFMYLVVRNPYYIRTRFDLKNFKMNLFNFLFLKSLVYAFNENFTAVHYSIVESGIDNEMQAGIKLKLNEICLNTNLFHHKFSMLRFWFCFQANLEWQCDGCSVVIVNESIIVENRFTEPNDFEISTDIDILESQNIRLTVEITDYIADLVQAEVLKEWFFLLKDCLRAQN